MSRDFLEWRTCFLVRNKALDSPLPDSLFAARPAHLTPRLPFEISLLLPIQKVRDPIPTNKEDLADKAAAVFMANPLLNVPAWISHFNARGVGWVSNFPSVTQYDDIFQKGLSDVGLGAAKELTLLAEFRKAGFRTMACVSTAQDACAAVTAGCDALLALPRVAAFLIGFPSIGQRSAQVAKIRQAVPDTELPLLALLQPAEANLLSTHPAGIDAGLIRPSSA